MAQELTQKIEAINQLLRAYGREAVQEIKMMKDGQVIGQVRYGYKPQYVFDAVNSLLLPENWRYEVISKDIFDKQVVAEVKLFIRTNDEWLCKGAQTGQMQIIRGNVGDAMKGAITDALQKCLSLLSVGTDAYKGLLKDVYQSGNNGQNKQRSSAPPKNNKQPAKNADHNDDLPMIAGIKYQHRDGIVIAIGDAYEKRELLKSAGFRWDKSDKNWFKEITVH